MTRAKRKQTRMGYEFMTPISGAESSTPKPQAVGNVDAAAEEASR